MNLTTETLSRSSDSKIAKLFEVFQNLLHSVHSCATRVYIPSYMIPTQRHGYFVGIGTPEVWSYPYTVERTKWWNTDVSQNAF